MKTKGRRQSKNVQDTRGGTGAYARPSGLTASRNYKLAGKSIARDEKMVKTKPSKLALQAGAGGINKLAGKLNTASAKKEDSLVDQVIKEVNKTKKPVKKKTKKKK